MRFYETTDRSVPAGEAIGRSTGAIMRVDSLLELDDTGPCGLTVTGDRSTWTIAADTVAGLRVWLALFGTPTAAKVRVLEGHYAHYGISDCGHEYTNLRPDGLASLGLGYSVDRDTDRSICLGCTNARVHDALEALKYGHGCVIAYVSEHGQTLTTRNGGELARIADTRYNDRSRSHWWQFQRGDRVFYGTNAGPGHPIKVRAYKDITPATR